MLALAVTAQKFGQRPSRLLGIADRGVALELDTVAALALDAREVELRDDLAARIANAVGRIFGGK